MSQFRQPSQARAGSNAAVTEQGAQSGAQTERSNPQSQQGVQQGLQFPTQSYLPENVRQPMIRQLTLTLSDSVVLRSQAEFAHWNVKGMAFHGLHELFDDIAEMFEDHVDLIAERITALGGQAMGTTGLATANCRVPAIPTQTVTDREFVTVLAERIAVHDANLNQDLFTANELNDLDTADLLNEVSREVTKTLWMLESHIQTQPIQSGASGQQAQQPGFGGPAQQQSQPLQQARPRPQTSQQSQPQQSQLQQSQPNQQ